MTKLSSVMRVLLLTLMAALLVLTYGCGGGGGSGTSQPVDIAGVTVRVQDATTGAPLAGASVRLGSTSRVTDAEGRATLNLPPGIYSLEVSHRDYQSFSSHAVCAQGKAFFILLAPNLPPATDQTFQQRSEQVFTAAQNLQRAITEVRNAPEDANIDVLLQFASAGNAFASTLHTLSSYTPSRGRLDFLSAFMGLIKVSQGTESTLDVRRRLYNGESVPEIDAWLAQNPFQGARSLQELRQRYPGPTIDAVLPRLLIAYERNHPQSGFRTAMSGAQDFFLAQLPDLLEGPKNLLGEAIDRFWNGAGKLVVKTVEWGSLVLHNKPQIAWLWDKVNSKLILTQVANEQEMRVPQTTYDIVISNGTAHKPVMVTDYPMTTTTQQLEVRPQPLTPPVQGTVYVGEWQATQTSSNNIGTWRHSIQLTLRLIIPSDPQREPVLQVSGTYQAVRLSLQPGVSLYEPESGSYTLSAEGHPRVGVMQTWDNNLAAGFVQTVDDLPRGESTVALDMGSMWRFGHSGIVTIAQPVTFRRQ